MRRRPAGHRRIHHVQRGVRAAQQDQSGQGQGGEVGDLSDIPEDEGEWERLAYGMDGRWRSLQAGTTL